MVFYVYILYSEKLDRYYVGSCDELSIRLNQHNAGRNTSTKAGLPWTLKYSEIYPTRIDARRREQEIKNKKSRKYIEWLVDSASNADQSKGKAQFS